MEEKDYWQAKINLETQYYEAKLALEKLVTKARIYPNGDWSYEKGLTATVDKKFLGQIPG